MSDPFTPIRSRSKKARRWGFRSLSDYSEVELEMKMFDVYVATGRLQAQPLYPRLKDGAAYGIVMLTRKSGSGSRPACKEAATILRFLKQAGIVSIDDELVPLAGNLSGYIDVMYGDSDRMPDSLSSLTDTGKCSSNDDKIKHVVANSYLHFQNKKPSLSAWRRHLMKTISYSVSEIVIRRSYSDWPSTFDAAEVAIMRDFSENNRTFMNLTQAVTIVEAILNGTFNSATCDGNVISRDEFLTGLICACAEARASALAEKSDGIQLAKHLVLYGSPGSGKSLLTALFFPNNIASSAPVDSCGVGCLEMEVARCILVFDDVGDAFYRNSGLLSAVKTMYHGHWMAKVHSSKQHNPPTCAVITTNFSDPIKRMCEEDSGCEEGAWRRRFIAAKFEGGVWHGIPKLLIPDYLGYKLFRHYIGVCSDFDDSAWNEDFKAMKATILLMQRNILRFGLDESSQFSSSDDLTRQSQSPVDEGATGSRFDFDCAGSSQQGSGSLGEQTGDACRLDD